MSCSREHPIHVFAPEFLDWLASRDRGGPSAPEAEYAGPWTVRPRANGFAVQRESDGESGVPAAELSDRETALLLAAVLPALGRERRYQVAAREGAAGVDVKAFGGGRIEKIGWLRHEYPEVLEALSVVEFLLRSPTSLALVLEAASYEALVQAGTILERRLYAQKVEVRDVMHTGDDVPRVETSTKMRDAISVVARSRQGITAVTDAESRLVGCLSDGDLRRFANDEAPLDDLVGEHMTPDPRTIDSTALASAAVKLLAEHRITSLFICDDEGRLEGIVHLNDLWRLEIFGR